MQHFENTRDYSEGRDRQSPLTRLREQFFIPRHGTTERLYFLGNSLGLQPRQTAKHLNEVLDAWAQLGYRAKTTGSSPWMEYHQSIHESLGRLVGAAPHEVVAMNSLTANIHLMLASFYQPTSDRFKILLEERCFPSDRYAIESHLRLRGVDPERALLFAKPRPGEATLRPDDLLELIEKAGKSIALIWLGQVQYYTGQAFDLEAISRAGHEQGCYVGVDLAHGIGNVELKLHDWQVDVATWCSYKYLNAGPGAVGGCYVHERHSRDGKLPRLAGWWGQEPTVRYKMLPQFSAATGAAGWQVSNPPILQLATLRAALEVFDSVGMGPLRQRSIELTGYLEYLLKQRLGKQVTIITPSAPEQRGCQLSILLHRAGAPETAADFGKRVYKYLDGQNLLACDWREPEVIRLAPTPLYNTFSDVYRAVEVVAAAVEVMHAQES